MYKGEKMLQISKLIKSRDSWKKKAIQKTYEAKEGRKTKKYYQKKIKEMKEENKKLKEIIEKNKKKD